MSDRWKPISDSNPKSLRVFLARVTSNKYRLVLVCTLDRGRVALDTHLGRWPGNFLMRNCPGCTPRDPTSPTAIRQLFKNRSERNRIRRRRETRVHTWGQLTDVRETRTGASASVTRG